MFMNALSTLGSWGGLVLSGAALCTLGFVVVMLSAARSMLGRLFSSLTGHVGRVDANQPRTIMDGGCWWEADE